MTRSAFIACIVLALPLYIALAHPSVDMACEVTPYFSPRGGCTAAVVSEIRKARKSVLVQAYSFTSPEIAAELVAARKRGVVVQAVFDRGQENEKYSLADDIGRGGVEVRFDEKHAISHNKVIVIDGRTVITGSFNFTANAEKSNAENLVVITSAQLAKVYADNWRQHWEHAITK